MSDKLKVVGAKALLDKPVLRVIRGDEANSSPPTTPDASWEQDQCDILDACAALDLNRRVIFPSVDKKSTEQDQDVEEIYVNKIANT